MSLEPGQLIDGKYRIVKMIGEGGMGAVYMGENVRINRKVAIKVLHAAYTGNQEVMQRFEREAQAAGRIGNDHILEVLDLGQLADGDHFIIMEYLEGEPLSGRIKSRGRLMPREATPVIRQVLEGLGAAHAAGIIHRDLKPDNIFILREKAGVADYVKIIDFGISKFNQLSGDGMKMTRTGAVMGTPYYMSPEQIRGLANLDARADVYALGVILYEALAGKRPFESDVLTHLAILIHAGECEPLERLRQDLPPGFADLVRSAMASDRDKRLQTAVDLRNRLERYGQVSFRTQTHISSMLPPPSMAPARSVGMATSGVGVSMQTPPPAEKSKRGLFIGLGACAAVALAGIAMLALQKENPAVGVGGSSTVGASTASGVSAEPTVTLPANTAGSAPIAIATEKAAPSAPEAAPSALTSAAASAATAVRSARSAIPTTTTQKPARSDERGLAKDNPFK